MLLYQHIQIHTGRRGVVGSASDRSSQSVVSSRSVKGSRYFLEQKTDPSLYSIGWFQERIQAWLLVLQVKRLLDRFTDTLNRTDLKWPSSTPNFKMHTEVSDLYKILRLDKLGGFAYKRIYKRKPQVSLHTIPYRWYILCVTRDCI